MPEYKIISITPLVDITPQGRFVKIYRVRFSYDTMEDFIDIPEEEYSDEEVRKRVEERVRIHSTLLGK